MTYEKRQDFFLYHIEGEKAVITGYEGHADELEIPASLEEKAVCKIGKKAFLGCKSLLKVTLPESMETLEEWAFAYCSNLRIVELPDKKTDFAKGVFFACTGLEQIRFKESAQTEDEESLWALLGAVPVLLDAEYLLTPWEAKEKHWVEKWDARMLSLLRAEDGEGYSKVVLCGEEDLNVNYEVFVEKKRQMKAGLAFIRLMHPYRLSTDIEEELLSFVREHTKLCESEAAWEVIKQHGDEKAYFEIFTKTGCLTEENFDAIIEDLGQYHAEMKAYFIRYHEEHLKEQDFFDTLSLDF